MYSYFNPELAQKILDLFTEEYEGGNTQGLRQKDLQQEFNCSTGVLATTTYGLAVRGFLDSVGLRNGRSFFKLSKAAVKLLESGKTLKLDDPLSRNFKNCVIYQVPVEVARNTKYMASLPPKVSID